MEQREEWFEESEEVFGEEVMVEVDAGMAEWISSVSEAAAGRYLNAGLPLPEPVPERPGIGGDWMERAVTEVLTECYSRRMLEPSRERVEGVAISVMPLPTEALYNEADEPSDESGDEPDGLEASRSRFARHAARRRWEVSVSEVARKVSVILRYGPSAWCGEGRILASGEERSVVVGGALSIRQHIDLLWRYPDGGLEAVIVAGEPDFGHPPGPVLEDWRVIFAAEVVRSEFGHIPEVHLVRVRSGVAQAARPSRSHLKSSLHGLARAALRARASRNEPGGIADGRDLEDGPENWFTYPLTPEAVAPLQRGDWPGGRPGHLRMNRPGNGRPRR